MTEFIIKGIIAIIGLVGGYLITAKTKLRDTIKGKLDNDTYNLLKNICKDFCQYASDKLSNTDEMKKQVNERMLVFVEQHNINISQEDLDSIRHAIIEEAKKVKEA